MALTDEQIKMMQEDQFAELVQILVERWHYTGEQALSFLYNSDTFCRLQDKRTGLYHQCPGYVYSFLENEMTHGHILKRESKEDRNADVVYANFAHAATHAAT